MRKKQRILLLPVLVTAVVMVLITWFSGQPVAVSDSLSRGLARRMLELLSIGASVEELDCLNHILRKLAHFILYFILGCGVTGITLRKSRRVPAAVFISILLGSAFAVSDELHQIFSEGRGPSIQDVMLDTCGVAVGSLSLTFFRCCLIRKKRD